MKQNLAFVSSYFNLLIVPQSVNDFPIAERFRHGLTNESLRLGMAAYQDFLHKLFDTLAESKDKVDVKRGSRYDPNGTKGDRGTSSIKDCFPVIPDIAMILVTVGFHGKLETNAEETKLTVRGDDLKTVICPITEKYVSVIKMSGERRAELSGLLREAGLRFNATDSGADFSEEIDFIKAETYTVTYENDDFFPIGLKLIAEASLNTKGDYKLENTLGKLVLRGDFRPLANAVPKPYKNKMTELGSAQPPEIKEWLEKAHTLLTSGGCVEYLGHPPFTYIKRGKTVTHGMVCIIEVGIGGCYVTPGVNHLGKPGEIIDSLPDDMADIMIKSAHAGKFDLADCRRKSGNMAFSRYAFTRGGQGYEGCRHAGLRCQYGGVECPFTGFSFDLSKTETRRMLFEWIKREVEERQT